MKYAKYILIVFLAAALVTGAEAGSIFSGGGIGLWKFNPGGRESGMGILGLGLADTSAVGGINPAVWAGGEITRFSGGASVTRYLSRGHGIDDVSDDFELQYVAVGVALKPPVVIGFRFFPQSRADIRLQSSESVGGNDYDRLQIYRGGISQASAVVSGRITDKLWAGGTVDFMFGTLDSYLRVNFDAIQDVEYRLTNHLFGVKPRLGLLFFPREGVSVGVTGAPGISLNVEREIDYTTSDSLWEAEDEYQVPFEIGVGGAFPLSGRFNGAVDVMYLGWDDQKKSIGNPSSYREAFFVGAGVELKPVERLLATVFQKSFYRLGANYRSFYYEFPAGESVTELSVSAGMGIPLKDDGSRLDFSLIVGQRGDLTANDLQETFVSFGLYINAGERWFIDRDEN